MKLDQQSKSLTVHAFLIAAVAGGAWWFGVAKMSKKLAETKSNHASRQSEIQSGQSLLKLAKKSPEERMRLLQGRADTLRDYWAASGDESLLYDTLYGLASNTGVRISRLDPRRLATARVPSDMPGTEGWGINTVGYSIDLTGNYDSVGKFLQAIEHSAGMSRVDSIRLMKTDESGDSSHLLRASISTTHYSLVGALEDVNDLSDAEGG